MGKFAASHTQVHRNTTKNSGMRRRIGLWLCFIVVFMGWVTYTLISQGSLIKEKNEQLSENMQLKEQTQQSLSELEYEVNRLQDPEYIGQIARKEFGLYLPEETPIKAESKTP